MPHVKFTLHSLVNLDFIKRNLNCVTQIDICKLSPPTFTWWHAVTTLKFIYYCIKLCCEKWCFSKCFVEAYLQCNKVASCNVIKRVNLLCVCVHQCLH